MWQQELLWFPAPCKTVVVNPRLYYWFDLWCVDDDVDESVSSCERELREMCSVEQWSDQLRGRDLDNGEQLRQIQGGLQPLRPEVSTGGGRQGEGDT